MSMAWYSVINVFRGMWIQDISKSSRYITLRSLVRVAFFEAVLCLSPNPIESLIIFMSYENYKQAIYRLIYQNGSMWVKIISFIRSEIIRRSTSISRSINQSLYLVTVYIVVYTKFNLICIICPHFGFLMTWWWYHLYWKSFLSNINESHWMVKRIYI